jgi:hypothetical protein
MTLADEYRRTVDPVGARRQQVRFPIGTRWLIVQMRWTGATWRDRWRDLWYLVRGG